MALWVLSLAPEGNRIEGKRDALSILRCVLLQKKKVTHNFNENTSKSQLNNFPLQGVNSSSLPRSSHNQEIITFPLYDGGAAFKVN